MEAQPDLGEPPAAAAQHLLSQGVILRMTLGAYRDMASARDQHERNVADQRVGASSAAQPALGVAATSLVHHGADSVLLTSVNALTLDLDQARPPGPSTPRSSSPTLPVACWPDWCQTPRTRRLGTDHPPRCEGESARGPVGTENAVMHI